MAHDCTQALPRGPHDAQWTRGNGGRPLLVILALCAAGLAISPPIAMDAPRGAASNPASKVIIAVDPARKSQLYWFLRTALGKAKGERIGQTQSEVWTVPTPQLMRLSLMLRVFGSKLSRIPDDFNELFKWQKDLALSAAQDEMVKAARSAPGFIGLGMMRAQQAILAEYALTTDAADVPVPAQGTPPKRATSAIIVPISATRQVTIQRVAVTNTSRGTTWRGKVTESGESALLMWWKEGRLSGMFAFEGHIYTIVNAGEDIYAVIESDPAKMPLDHAAATSDSARPKDGGLAEATAEEAPASFTPFSDKRRRALEAKKVTIDLMMLYTRRAASRYLQGPKDVIELAVEQANQTFRNSGIPNVSLRLVHAQMLDYDEAGGAKLDHLFRMVDGAGAFKDVGKLRDEKHADIVGLMLEDPRDCGLSARVGGAADEAYFVVHHSCAALTISIAHEVGHILGARHDRSIDKNDRPFPYAHGYVNGTKWRDIMSYNAACNGCPRIPFWSNPRVMYEGEPTGTETEDNARVILEQAERVSKFR
jgi:peptidyl-Asp metalloendopeptidase